VDIDRETISEIIEECWKTKDRVEHERYLKQRRTDEREFSNSRIVKEEKISLESFQGIQKHLVNEYKKNIQYAIKAVYRQSFSRLRRGILLRLEDDFTPVLDTGNMDDLIPGCHFDFIGNEFCFRIGSIRGCSIQSLEELNQKYIELGTDNMNCLTTFAYLALSY
jgi:hypothetical protein